MSVPNTVFLPGMLCDARLFAAQTEAMTTPHQVANMTGPDSIAGIARQVLADAPERFAAVGLSMGGIVALEMWRQAPQRLTHLLLIDTTAHPGPPDQRPNKLEAIAGAAASGQRAEVAPIMPSIYFAKANKDNESLLNTMLDMAQDIGIDAFNAQACALRTRSDSRDTLATITVPTAVVCGAEDLICTPQTHQEMAEAIPEATLSILPDCGHMATMECPEQVNAILHSLLSR